MVTVKRHANCCFCIPDSPICPVIAVEVFLSVCPALEGDILCALTIDGSALSHFQLIYVFGIV